MISGRRTKKTNELKRRQKFIFEEKSRKKGVRWRIQW